MSLNRTYFEVAVCASSVFLNLNKLLANHMLIVLMLIVESKAPRHIRRTIKTTGNSED